MQFALNYSKSSNGNILIFKAIVYFFFHFIYTFTFCVKSKNVFQLQNIHYILILFTEVQTVIKKIHAIRGNAENFMAHQNIRYDQLLQNNVWKSLETLI